MKKHMDLHVLPRQTMTWKQFTKETPRCSIALDGMVSGGPRYEPKTQHVNFDHHDKVVREATMATCMQVYHAIKGNLMKYFTEDGKPIAHVYINDTDQDTALAVWLLDNYKLLEGVQSLPNINRLLELNHRLDITGGGFPMNLDDQLVRQHNWVMAPYTDLRKSGALANASAEILRDNLDATMQRITKLMMGEAGEKDLDTRYEVLHASPNGFLLIDEIGGNEARYHLFQEGMDNFIAIIATRPDGARVCTIGKRTPYSPFPVEELYDVFNEAEGLTRENGWNGSNLIGGSSRQHGTKLTNEQLWQLADKYIMEKR